MQKNITEKNTIKKIAHGWSPEEHEFPEQ